VQSAIGYDAARGDTVTIDSMAFDESVANDLRPASLTDRVSLDVGRIVQTLVLAAAALFIAFGLLRPLLTRPADTEADRPEAIGVAAAAPPDALGPPSGTPDAAETGVAPSYDAATGLPAPTRGGSAGRQIGFALADSAPSEEGPLDPVDRLRRLIGEREEETVEILRSWMEEDDEVKP
jgi:flagellar M-ring protein FliF